MKSCGCAPAPFCSSVFDCWPHSNTSRSPEGKHKFVLSQATAKLPLNRAFLPIALKMPSFPMQTIHCHNCMTKSFILFSLTGLKTTTCWRRVLRAACRRWCWRTCRRTAQERTAAAPATTTAPPSPLAAESISEVVSYNLQVQLPYSIIKISYLLSACGIVAQRYPFITSFL